MHYEGSFSSKRLIAATNSLQRQPIYDVTAVVGAERGGHFEAEGAGREGGHGARELNLPDLQPQQRVAAQQPGHAVPDRVDRQPAAAARQPGVRGAVAHGNRDLGVAAQLHRKAGGFRRQRVAQPDFDGEQFRLERFGQQRHFPLHERDFRKRRHPFERVQLPAVGQLQQAPSAQPGRRGGSEAVAELLRTAG